MVGVCVERCVGVEEYDDYDWLIVKSEKWWMYDEQDNQNNDKPVEFFFFFEKIFLLLVRTSYILFNFFPIQKHFYITNVFFIYIKKIVRAFTTDDRIVLNQKKKKLLYGSTKQRHTHQPPLLATSWTSFFLEKKLKGKLFTRISLIPFKKTRIFFCCVAHTHWINGSSGDIDDDGGSSGGGGTNDNDCWNIILIMEHTHTEWIFQCMECT